MQNILVNCNNIYSLKSNYYNLESQSNINLISNKNSNDAIILSSNNQNGGILLNTNKGGLNINCNQGPFNLNVNNQNINIGSDKTNSISFESLEKISMNSEDFYLITSDSINFLSQTGNINFGSQVGESFIKSENYNLLLNKNTSNLNRRLDIQVDEESSLKGYNGININSINKELSSDIILDNKLQITYENDTNFNSYSNNNKLIASQKDNLVFIQNNYLNELKINFKNLVGMHLVWQKLENDKFNESLNNIENHLSDVITKTSILPTITNFSSNFKIDIEFNQNIKLNFKDQLQSYKIKILDINYQNQESYYIKIVVFVFDFNLKIINQEILILENKNCCCIQDRLKIAFFDNCLKSLNII